MTDPEPSFLGRFRAGYLGRILLLYGGASWAIIQFLDILDHFALPEWLFFTGIALLLIGLPVVLGTAMYQESREERDDRAEREEGGETPTEGGETLTEGGEVRTDARGKGSDFFRRWLTVPRAVLGGVLAFTLLGLVALAMAWWKQPGKTLDRSLVAVMPFRTVGLGSDLWSEGIVDLLSSALDASGVVLAADPRAVMAGWHRRVDGDGEPGTREDAAEVAVDLGSGRMVLGSLIETGPDRVELIGDLFDVRWMRKEASVSVSGARSEIPNLLDDLTIELLKAILRESEVPAVRVSAITTSSVPALRAYLEGTQAFRRSRFTEARARFLEAVELDSTFAIAAYGLSWASGWTDLEQAYLDATLLAARHAGGLPIRDSLLIVGQKMIHPDSDPAAIELFETLARLHPEDFDSWNGLAEAIFHLGHEAGVHLDRVVEALAQAYAIDSTVAPAYFHGIQSAFILDDTAQARRWASTYLALDSAPAFAGSLRLALALRLGPDRDRAAAMAALDTLTADEIDRILWFAPPGRSNLAYAETLLGAAAGAEPTEVERAAALRRLGREYIRHGRIGVWWAVQMEAGALDRAPPDLWYLTAARMAGLVADSSLLAQHDRLAEAAPYPAEATFLSAFWAKQGQMDRAQEAISWLERSADSVDRAGDPISARDRRGAALAYRGHLALARGDTAAAVDLLRRGVAMIRPEWGGARSLHRFVLAGLLAEDPGDEATRILGAMRQPTLLEAPSYLQAARLHEKRGNRPMAIRYYRWFLDLWAEADPYLQPQVRSAREALDRLTAASPPA